MVIPVSFAGPLNLQYVDYSVEDCRTEYFNYIAMPSFSTDSSRMIFILENSNWQEPDLAPGSGPLLKLYFSIPASIKQDPTATISFPTYSNYTPLFIGQYLSYSPLLAPGTVSLTFICGDANQSRTTNLLDVSYIINHLYRGGPPPPITQAAYTNGDGKLNLLDISYLINYLYRAGPTLQCRP